MNSQEAKWFKHYTWKHEVGTTEVVIELQRGMGETVTKLVSQYLTSIGFIDDSDPKASKRSHDAWYVDLVNKKFRLTTSWEVSCMPSKPFHAWPSQIMLFTSEKKAQLAGARFGV
jgi:hypothetical protein